MWDLVQSTLSSAVFRVRCRNGPILTMAGNLPPGVTPRDIDRHYGPSVPNHDHRWFPAHDVGFVLEDGEAKFQYVCEWAPTKTVDLGMRGTEEIAQGEQCGAECSFELETDAGEDAVMTVESADIDDTLSVAECDPPGPERQGGRLVVEVDGYEVVYE